MKSSWKSWVAAGICALAAVGPATPGAASVERALDLTEMTASADRIVVGEVLSVKSAWETGKKRIFTNIEVKVSEIWKGAPPAGGKLLLQQPGGQVGDIEMRVYGLTEFHAGDKAVLFLRGTDAASALLGLGQGVRPLRFDGAQKRWMVEGSDRSSAVTTDRDGRLGAPAAPEAALPLDTLRARVRQLVQK